MLLLVGADDAADAVPLTAEQVQHRWHSRLDGRHFSVNLTLSAKVLGREDARQLVLWRDHTEEGERVMIRFDAPSDLRGVGLLYLERRDQPNDYFLYQPATRRVRRLPQVAVKAEAFGIDLEFIGFGVARTEPTRIESMTRTRLNGTPAYRLIEVAERENARFDRRSTWLDASSFMALRTEHEREGRLMMVAEVSERRTVQGVPTPMRVSFNRLDLGLSVELVVEKVDYNSEIPAEYFSTMALVRGRIQQELR